MEDTAPHAGPCEELDITERLSDYTAGRQGSKALAQEGEVSLPPALSSLADRTCFLRLFVLFSLTRLCPVA